MIKPVCSIIILFFVLGLINCNGAKRPWPPAPGNQPGTDERPVVKPGPDSGTGETPAITPGPANGGVQGEVQIVFSNVQPLFKKHCTICHDADNASPPDQPYIDWLDYATAKSKATTLRERVWELWEKNKKDYEAGNIEDPEDYENFAEYEEYLEVVMPLGNPEGMTEEDRKMIRDWIDGGAL